MLKLDKLKTAGIIEYIFCVLMVYCNGSWLLFEAKTFITIAMIAYMFFYLVIRKAWFNDLQAPNSSVIFFALFPFISLILNLNNDVNLISVLFVSITYLFLSCFSTRTYDALMHKYAHFIYVLMLISIVFGLVTLVDYSVLTIVPVSADDLFGSNSTMGYYNFLLYTDRVANDFRTQSIFWEPGAWAFNEIFAFYWFIFIQKDYNKLPYIILSMLLTLSTTGLFLSVILLGACFISIDSSVLRRKILQIASLGAILMVVGSTYIAAKADVNIIDLFYEQTVEKFTSDSKSVSFAERLETTKEAYEIAEEHPFFGIGKATTENQIFVTSGIAEIVYQLGFLYLVAYLVYFRVLFSKLGWLLSCIFVMIMINGEAYGFHILSSLILIYGTKHITIRNPLAKNFSAIKRNQFELIK